MRRLFGIMALVLFMLIGTNEANARRLYASHAYKTPVGGFVVAKLNTEGHWGLDGAVTFYDRYGVRFGFMSDFYHPFGSGEKYHQNFDKVLGKGYRLSYTVGPTVKALDWLWFGASVGYGEYGTYSYSTMLNKYGISEKVKGLELGLLVRYVYQDCVVLEVGYGTIPTGFKLDRPLHDISFGIGFCF